MPRNVSWKRQADGFVASTLPGTPCNSGAELRSLVDRSELRISSRCAPRLPEIAAQCGCSRSACILGDPQVGAFLEVFMQEAAPLGFVHLHDEVQQDSPRLHTLLCLWRASLPAAQARSHDEVRLLLEHLFAHVGSVSRIEKIPHLPTHVRPQVRHVPCGKMHACRTKDLRRQQLCHGCSCDTRISTVKSSS